MPLVVSLGQAFAVNIQGAAPKLFARRRLGEARRRQGRPPTRKSPSAWRRGLVENWSFRRRAAVGGPAQSALACFTRQPDEAAGPFRLSPCLRT